MRFFIVDVRAHVSDMRIGQADNLSRITGVGENFLISGEAGIENNFAAAARYRAGGAAVKYSPVFERKNGGVSVLRRQRSPPVFRNKLLHLCAADAEIEPKWSTGQYAKTALP